MTLSDSRLCLIPRDPNFVPPVGGEVRRALDALRAALPGADEVTAEVSEVVWFYDAGSNWEGVRCPSCGRRLDDAWGDAMERALEEHVLDFITPCCGYATTLNDLDYVWACGFARFALIAMNPNVEAFPDELLRNISQIIGTPMKTVWRRL